MEYIHVRTLEKYHPGYKDRELKWAKIQFGMVQGDPDCEMITDEIDFGRLIKLILLELQARKPIPIDDIYLTKKGFNLKKRPISLTINMLQNFLTIVPEDSKNCVLDIDKEVDKEVDKDKEIDSGEANMRYKILEEKFQSFWKAYPRKDNKPTVKRIFYKLNPDDELFSGMMQALQNQIQAGMYEDKKYTPMPSTWLNQERWNNEIIIKEKANGIYSKHITEDKLRRISEDIANDTDLQR